MKGVLTGRPSMAGRPRTVLRADGFVIPTAKAAGFAGVDRPPGAARPVAVHPSVPGTGDTAAGWAIDEGVRGCESAGAVTAAAAPFAERGKGCPLRPSSG